MLSLRTVPFAITLVVLAALGAAACDAPRAVLEAPDSVAVAEGRATSFAFTAAPGAELTITSSADDLVAVRNEDAIDVTARIGAASGTITISDDTNGVEAAVDVTVTPLAFERVEWQAASPEDGPKAREHGALFVSADGGTVYLLQGGGYPNFPTQEVIDDAWQLDVDSGTWSPWEISGDVPPPAGSRRASQAPGSNVAYLFGGYDGAFVGNGELYRVDVATGTFTLVEQQNVGPLQRSLHAFAFDASGNRVIVYGGFYSDAGGAQDILDDTWIGLLDDAGTSVTWLEVTGGPSARYGMFFGIDESLARFVVWSGAGFPSQADPVNALDDAWLLELDGEGGPAWREISPGGDAPAGRRNGCGVVDPTMHGLFVFGGTSDGATTQQGMFALDLEREAWTALEREGEPPARSSSFGAAVPGGGIVCGMGNDDALYRDLFWLR